MEDSTSFGSKRFRVRVKTTSTEYEGIFHSPQPDRRLSEVVGRIDQFINLKNAVDYLSREEFPFVVISKNSIETIKVVEELN